MNNTYGEGKGLVEIDELTIKGVELLREFISGITVPKKYKNEEYTLQQIVKLINDGGDFWIYASIDVLSGSNVIDKWSEYRDRFVSWLNEFLDRYNIEAVIDGLPNDYKARVAMLTIMLLARDLVETRYYALSSEARQVIDGHAVTWSGISISLYDLTRYVYPTTLWISYIAEGTEPIRIAAMFSKTIRDLYVTTKKTGKDGGSTYRIYKLIYLPLIITGLVGEDVLYKLIGLADPELLKKEQKNRFFTTGLGQAFLKISTFAFRYSLSTAYYRTAIAALAAISHAHYSVLTTIINQILSTDVRGNVDFMQSEYMKYSQYADAFPNVYRQAYTHDNALRDLFAMILTLINLRNEINELAARGLNPQIINQALGTLMGKYPFLVSGSVDELIRDVIKVTWFTSGRVT
jgi:hypothetical protein